MICREFERRWNEWLDAREAGEPAFGPELEAHASACERCRATSARFQLLRQATSAWPPMPAPSAGSLERLHALTGPVAGRSRPVSRPWIELASAAALLAAAWVGWSALRPPDAPDRMVASDPMTPVVEARPIQDALEGATEATIDLARTASAPAARIGRELLVLDTARDSVTMEGADDPVDLENGPPPSELPAIGRPPGQRRGRADLGVGPACLRLPAPPRRPRRRPGRGRCGGE